MQSAAHANQIRTLMVWMLTFVDLMQVSGNYVSLIINYCAQQYSKPHLCTPFFQGLPYSYVFPQSFFAVLSVSLVILLLSPYP